MQQRERELLNPIINGLGTILDQIAKKGKYTIIFEKSKQGIIWAENKIDLTEDLVKKFEADNTSKKKKEK